MPTLVPLFAVAPIKFQLEELGGRVADGKKQDGVLMRVARLPHKKLANVHPHFFLTVDEYNQLVRFILEEPSEDSPQLFLPVGTIKSGKTALVTVIIERLVMALREEDARNGGKGISRRPPPVFLNFTFDERCSAERAAEALIVALEELAKRRGIMIAPHSKPALLALPIVARNVAKAIRETGHELWLNIDEAQGPIVGSDFASADEFAQKIKHVRSAVCGLLAEILRVSRCRGVVFCARFPRDIHVRS